MVVKKRSPLPAIKVPVTNKNLESAKKLASLMGCSLAEIVRIDLKFRCAQHGIEWGEDIASHGGHRVKNKDVT